MPLNQVSFIHELKRRNVLKVGGAYLLAALGLAAGVTELVNLFDLDRAVARTFTIIAIFGFPVAMFLAWRYELTPDGVVTDDVASANNEPRNDLLATTVILSGADHLMSVYWNENGETRSANFTKEFFIGRDPTCEVALNNPAVSRRHARVWLLHNQWIIEDLQSQNGTLIDGKRIEKQALSANTEVSLSEHGPVIRFEAPESDANAATVMISPETVARISE